MSTAKLPKGPGNISLLEKLQQITNPLEFFEKQAQLYGDIFTLPVTDSKYTAQVVISNPEGIEKIFTANLKQLDSGKEAAL